MNRESVQKNTPKKNTPAERSTRTIIHKVREGETLAAIARRYYRNDTERWPEIFAANRDRLKDPDFLTPGMELRIPGVLVPGSDSISRRNDRLKMTEMVRR